MDKESPPYKRSETKNLDGSKVTTDDVLQALNSGHKKADTRIKILTLKRLLAVKQAAQVILDDDTVNNWMLDKEVTRKYSEAEVKQAAEDFNEAQKEIDKIISEL